VPVVQLRLDQITPRPDQPRRYFGGKALDRLADSIRVHGVIQPLTVHEAEGGYQLVAGERRWRAARTAGLTEVPVRVLKALSDLELKQYSAVENLQREDLNAVDEADAVLDILEAQLGLDRAALTPTLECLKSIRMRDPELSRATAEAQALLEQVERAFQGLGRGAWTSFVSNRLPVLRLPEDLLTAVRGGTLEYTKALTLRSAPEAERGELIEFARQASLSELRQRLRRKKTPELKRAKDPFQDVPKTLTASDWTRLSPTDRDRAQSLLQEAAALLKKSKPGRQR